jgi:hypothetical protein
MIGERINRWGCRDRDRRLDAMRNQALDVTARQGGTGVIWNTLRIGAAALLTVVTFACSSVSPAAPGGPGSSTVGDAGRPTANPANPGGPAQPGQGGASIDSCSILSDEEIQAATDELPTQRRASTLTQVFSSVCDINLDNGGSLTISVLPQGGKAMYETSFEPFIGEGAGPLDEALSGLGDKAARSGQDIIMALKDDVLFEIQYIEFGRDNKLPIVRYLADLMVAKIACLPAACPAMTLPPRPTGGALTTPPPPLSADPGSLPETGAQTRVVNLYTENGQPVTIDVYGYKWSDADMSQVGALVATVPYGTASAWFNPGVVKSPYSDEGETRIEIFRQGDRSDLLAGIGESVGEAGTIATILAWQEEVYEGQPGMWTSVLYAAHPTNPVPSVAPDKAILLGNDGGLDAEKEPPTLYASVGDSCLEGSLGRSDPDIPNAQPLGNELALPMGQHTLTVHDAPIGELATCSGKPLGPGVPITVNPGDRLIALPHRLTASDEIELLVLPYGLQ